MPTESAVVVVASDGRSRCNSTHPQATSTTRSSRRVQESITSQSDSTPMLVCGSHSWGEKGGMGEGEGRKWGTGCSQGGVGGREGY